jgi:hypothetical protein
MRYTEALIAAGFPEVAARRAAGMIAGRGYTDFSVRVLSLEGKPVSYEVKCEGEDLETRIVRVSPTGEQLLSFTAWTET